MTHPRSGHTDMSPTTQGWTQIHQHPRSGHTDMSPTAQGWTRNG